MLLRTHDSMFLSLLWLVISGLIVLSSWAITRKRIFA